MVGYVLIKRDGETWLDAILRLSNHGMAVIMPDGSKLSSKPSDVQAKFEDYLLRGYRSERAAWTACMDFGLLEWFDALG